jgi:hypothetical protein
MKKIIPFLALITVFHSCDVVVDLDIEDHTPVLVLNSLLSPDSIAAVSLSHSLGAFEQGSISEVKDATVRLYENDSYLTDAIYVEDDFNLGYYQFEDVYPSSGKTYKVEALHDDYETVFASTRIPELVPINSLLIDTVIEYQDEFFTDYTSRITFNFDDHPQQENFYMLEIVQEDEYSNYPLYFFSNEASFSSGMVEPDSEYSYWGNVAVFSDNLFNGNTKSIEVGFWDYFYLNDEGEVNDNQIKVRFSSITREYYLYKKSRSASSGSDDFFGGEPIQIYTNVQNGLGVVVSKATDEYILE